jgi:hypothetical protein
MGFFTVTGIREPLVMPTDLGTPSAPKRKAQVQAQAQAETTMLLFWGIICLGMLGVLFEVLGR